MKALLGAKKAFAFDVSTACAGFVYGMSIAHGYLQNPRFSRGVVVASETTSQRGRPASKSTLVFGDAAGAAVFTDLTTSQNINYCTGQCTYDMPVYSPPGHPNIVYIGGAMQYSEIFTANRPSNGRAVQRSDDAGVS